MSFEPFAVVGAARRAALRARVLADVGTWLKQWSTVPASSLAGEVSKVTDADIVSATATARVVAHAEVEDRTHLYVLASGEGLLQLLGLPGINDAWQAQGDSVASQTLRSMVKSLAQTLMSNSKRPFDAVIATPGKVAEMRAAANSYGRWWKITVDCAAHRSALVLMISPRLLSWFAPPPPGMPANDIVQRSAAIVEDSVRIEAVLGEVELTIGDLAALGLDDVVVLEESLSQAASLRSTRGVNISNAFLGRLGSKRAVRLRN